MWYPYYPHLHSGRSTKRHPRTLGSVGSLVLVCWGGRSDLQGLWAQGPGGEDTCGLRAWLA